MSDGVLNVQVPDYGAANPVASVEEKKIEAPVVQNKLDKELVEKVRRKVIKGQIDGR